MARFVRNSVLRKQGIKPAAVLQLRSRARRAEATVAAVRETVAAVKTPNGTTQKIARLLGGVA